MGLCSDPPPPPDMSEYSDAMLEIAEQNLEFSMLQYETNTELLNSVLDVQLPIMEQNAVNAQEDREFYEQVYRPLEENLVQEFQDYDTEARREQEAGEAVADVTTGFEAQRENALRELEGYGIDPSQTRSQALDADMRIQEATAQAGAANKARKTTEATGRALRGEALNIGRGYASNVAGAYSTALNAGNSAVGNQMNTSSFNPYAGYANTVGAAGNLTSQGYNNELAAFNAGNAIPTAIAGAGAGALTSYALAADGGEVVGPGGPKEDAIPVRLSAEEYVIPAEVVKWKGLEFFEKQIANSRQALSERDAQMAPGGNAGIIPPPTGIPQETRNV